MGRRDELLAKAEAEIINEYNASYAGMTIDGPIFRYGAKEYPINSISAEVLLGAQTSKSRSTATRIIGGGMVAGPGGMLLGGAAKKKTDTSKVYITIKLGDGSVHSIARPSNEEGRLRGFSDKLESAVNRKWPIQTPYGTTLKLDPDSTRASSTDASTWMIGGGLAITVALFFVIHWWALLVGLVLFLAISAFAAKQKQAFEMELDEHFPGWRKERVQSEADQKQRMWDQARRDAEDDGTS